MKDYKFNTETLEKALDLGLIIQNLRFRMQSIVYIVSKKEELNIDENYIDLMYKQYLELEKELSEHLKIFYKNVYDSFEIYDNKIEELTKK